MGKFWTDIVLEGFCTCKEKKKCGKKVPSEEEKMDGITKPVAKKLIPEYWCLITDCPWFGYCNGGEKLYLWLNKYYKEKSDNL